MLNINVSKQYHSLFLHKNKSKMTSIIIVCNICVCVYAKRADEECYVFVYNICQKVICRVKYGAALHNNNEYAFYLLLFFLFTFILLKR